MSKSFLNNHISRGLRNNNPGNLIYTPIPWQGKIPKPQSKDSKFEQFIDLKHGIRAMLKDVINDINKGKNTVTKLIEEYAPPSENNTKSYISSVSKTIGIGPTQPIKEINNSFLLVLSRAIFKVELAPYHTQITDSDINEAIASLGEVSTNILKVTIKKSYKTVIPALLFVAFFF